MFCVLRVNIKHSVRCKYRVVRTVSSFHDFLSTSVMKSNRIGWFRSLPDMKIILPVVFNLHTKQIRADVQNFISLVPSNASCNLLYSTRAKHLYICAFNASLTNIDNKKFRLFQT